MSAALKDGFGYTVDRPMHGDVRALRCQFCVFSVSPAQHFRQGDKSGLGRYNRARGIMVKHVHDKHRDKINPEGLTP